MSDTLRVQINHREIHARAFALDKARQVRGVIVESVLNRLPSASIPIPIPAIEAMEEHVERFVAALIKNSVMEFTDMYTADLEQRLDAMLRIQEDELRVQP